MRIKTDYLLVVLLTIFILLPISAQADDTQYFDKQEVHISEIDNEIERVLRRRKVLTQEIKEIHNWSQQLSNWLGEQEKTTQALNQAKQNKGDYGTMRRDQLQDEIDSLEARLEKINNPPGGKRIGNNFYYSLNDAYNDISMQSEHLHVLHKQDFEYNQQLSVLDTKRDDFVRRAQESTGTFIKENKPFLDHLRNVREQRIREANDPLTWCEQHVIEEPNSGLPHMGPVVCQDRKQTLIFMVHKYREEIIKTGEPYSEVAIKKMIRDLEAESERTKRLMRKRLIPQLEEAIAQAEIDLKDAQKAQNINPVGCWFMWLPSSNRKAIISIRDDRNPGYEGKISEHGWLNLPNGHVLFKVDRINAATFEGTEYSIFNRKKTWTALRLIIDENRNNMTYRTKDDMVNLTPCN